MMTIINFSKQVEDILNLNELPVRVQKVIKMADNIVSSGFQELHGYKNRKLIFSIGGYWEYADENRMQDPTTFGFVVTSIGAKFNEELACGNISFVELQWSNENI